MKFLDSQWARIRFSLTPTQLRFGLAILSVVALVLGGSADEGWD